MTTVEIEDIAFTVRVDGTDEDKPWIVLSNSLGADHTMWDPQIPFLTERYRVLRYDTRGHGGTPPGTGPYSFELLASDVLRLMGRHGIERTAFMGLSLGGMTGVGLALNASDRFERFVIADARGDAPDAFVRSWDERMAAVKETGGTEVLLEGTLARWFTEATRAARPDLVEYASRMIRGTSPEGYVACAHALKGLNHLTQMHRIRKPMMFVVGAEDQGTPPAASRTMHAMVEGSDYAEVPGAAHVSNLEQPEAFNAAIAPFLGMR